MNISVKGEYALQAVFDLSLQPPGEPVKIADIARRQKIPQKFLELILASLKQGGLRRIAARRGRRLPAGAAGRIDHGGRGAALRGRRQAQPERDAMRDAVPADVETGGRGSLRDHRSHHVRRAGCANWQKSQTRYVANWEI